MSDSGIGRPPAGGLEAFIVDRFGRNRLGGPNTRAAAAAAGVDQRQVQRWLRAEREGRTVQRSERLGRLRAQPPAPAAPSTPVSGAATVTAPAVQSTPSFQAPPTVPHVADPAARRGPQQNALVDEALTERARQLGALKDIDRALIDLYGTNQAGNPDVRAAAADLGVHPRTVQRWRDAARQGREPANSAAFDRLTGEAQDQAATRGREQMRQRGATVTVTGRVTISSDTRQRTITYNFAGDEMDALYDALSLAGPGATNDVLSDWLDDYYAGGIDVDGLEEFDVQ